jgi:hypothetical protein
MDQLEIQFQQNEDFGGQLLRLYRELKAGFKITCQDAQRLGIAGTALPRRIKDLRDIHKVPIKKEKVPYVRSFDGKEVRISQYSL